MYEDSYSYNTMRWYPDGSYIADEPSPQYDWWNRPSYDDYDYDD